MAIDSIFGNIFEDVAVFVLDISRSMEDMIPIIRNHLRCTLTELATSKPGFKFNIIVTNDKSLSKWSDKVVECTSHTVRSALRWLEDVKCRKNKNILKGVRAAELCMENGGIYLVLNGIEDESLHEYCFVNPVNCILLSFDKERFPGTDDIFCEDLATLTRGSFFLVFLTDKGNVRKVIEVWNSSNCPADVKTSSIETSLGKTVVLEPSPVISPVVAVPGYPFYRPYPTLDLVALREEFHKTPIASVVARGTKVLARRQDGFYYRGSIAQEIERSQSAFMIEFEKTKQGPEMRMEEVPLHDIIALRDAERHSIVPGDKVLAQWSTAKARYGPGDVLSGVENRVVIGDRKDTDLVVSYWNGKTEKVYKGEAVWIPGPLYDRIVSELQMPISARKSFNVIEKSPKLSPPILHDDVLQVPFIDPLYRSLYYTWWNRGYFYLPTYPLLTSVPTYLRSWPHFLYHRPHVLYERYPWQYYPETVTPYRRYPIEQPNMTADEDLDCMEHKKYRDDRTPDKKHLSVQKYNSSSSSSSSSSDNEEYLDLLENKKHTSDKGTNTEYRLRNDKRKSFLRKEPEIRPEWKKYWPQTPQPRYYHQHSRRNTWDTSYGLDYQPHHERGYDPQYVRSMEIADCKRHKTLMRIRSDIDKQRKYEEQIQRTIDAKAKINQDFRNRFYEKELTQLNRRNLHQAWLQDRRNRYETAHAGLAKAAFNKERLHQFDRQVRQMAYGNDVARNACVGSNYQAALEGNRKARMSNRRARLLEMETHSY